MAHAETLGWGACDCCGEKVAVKLNRSALAYYRCDHCGVEVRHHWHKTSDRLAGQFAPAASSGEGEGKPAPAANRGHTPPAKPAGGGLAGLLGLGG